MQANTMNPEQTAFVCNISATKIHKEMIEQKTFVANGRKMVDQTVISCLTDVIQDAVLQ